MSVNYLAENYYSNLQNILRGKVDKLNSLVEQLMKFLAIIYLFFPYVVKSIPFTVSISKYFHQLLSFVGIVAMQGKTYAAAVKAEYRTINFAEIKSRIGRIDYIYDLVAICIAILSVFALSACSSSIRFSSDRVGNLEVNRGRYTTVAAVGNSYKTYNDNTRTYGSSSEAGIGAESLIGTVLSGKASFYSDSFDGELTASGDVYHKNELTAAHQTLPFGTKVEVTNLRNNKTVIVVINDRGPFKGGRMIDLSYAAAQRLDMLNDGVVDVEVKILK